MNSSPSMNPGSLGAYPMTCPHCGAPTVQRTNCEHCGAPLKVNPTPNPNLLGASALPLPSEYTGLARPKVSSSISAASFFMVVFGLFWTLFSLVFVVAAAALVIREQQVFTLLSSEGQPAQGVVTDRQVDDSDDSTTYTIFYRYSAPVQGTPRVFEQEQSVPYELYAALRVGEVVPVIFAATQPNVARLKADFHAPELLGPLLMGLIGLLFVVIGLFMLAGAIVSLQDYFRLRRSGLETSAVVFERWEDRDSDGDVQCQVAYAFRAPLPDGTLGLLTHAETHRQAYLATQTGSTITVRYLPEDPSTSQIVRFR